MSDYRLFFFENARISAVRDIQADEDAEAIEHAREVAGDRTAELWCGTSKIEIFNPTA